MFCTFSSVDLEMGFENYVLNILNFDCDLQRYPLHVVKNISIKYKPTIYRKSTIDRIYVSTMGYHITDFSSCEHTYANPYRCRLIRSVADTGLKEIIVHKAKTMNMKQLVNNVDNSVREMAFRYSILVSPKLVYELSIAIKRLVDNLEYIEQKCTCLRILSCYCHCAAVQYFV
jgi:hypothetical protein